MLYWEFGIVFASEELIYSFPPSSFSSAFCAHGRPGTLAQNYMILSIFVYNNNNNNNNYKGGFKKREVIMTSFLFFCLTFYKHDWQDRLW